MSEENKGLGDMADDAMDSAKEGAENIGDKAGDALDSAKETASEFADDAKKTANEFSDNAKEAFNDLGGENKKLMAGILAIVLGSLGIHKFILGYQKEGIIMLVVTLVLGFFTCGAGASLMGLIGLIEGIIYLTKSDEEFKSTYQEGRKPWF